MSDREQAYRDVFYSVHRNKTNMNESADRMFLSLNLVSLFRIISYASIFYSMHLGIALLMIVEAYNMIKIKTGK